MARILCLMSCKTKWPVCCVKRPLAVPGRCGVGCASEEGRQEGVVQYAGCLIVCRCRLELGRPLWREKTRARARIRERGVVALLPHSAMPLTRNVCTSRKARGRRWRPAHRHCSTTRLADGSHWTELDWTGLDWGKSEIPMQDVSSARPVKRSSDYCRCKCA